ncbi:hypothetical protein HN011_010544 [Eciton burchellii]|nr:hypothetical protein HN011_010544 [Eciton burchellii]
MRLPVKLERSTADLSKGCVPRKVRLDEAQVKYADEERNCVIQRRRDLNRKSVRAETRRSPSRKGTRRSHEVEEINEIFKKIQENRAKDRNSIGKWTPERIPLLAADFRRRPEKSGVISLSLALP